MHFTRQGVELGFIHEHIYALWVSSRQYSCTVNETLSTQRMCNEGDMGLCPGTE